jgi:phage host-nuclease inhibitor protein Gam
MISKFHGLVKGFRVLGNKQGFLANQTKLYYSKVKNPTIVSTGTHPGIAREKQYNDDNTHQVERENVPGRGKSSEPESKDNMSQLNDQPKMYTEKLSPRSKTQDSVDPNQEIKRLRQKFADELKSISESHSEKVLSAQTIRDIMDSVAKLSPEEFTNMYNRFSKEMPKATKNLSATEISDHFKSLVGNPKNWETGKTRSVLENGEIQPAVWEKEMDYYIKEDNTFGSWYTNLQQSLIEKNFPLEELSDAQKKEIQEYSKKHYDEHSKETKTKGVSYDKVIEDLQNKYSFNVKTHSTDKGQEKASRTTSRK